MIAGGTLYQEMDTGEVVGVGSSSLHRFYNHLANIKFPSVRYKN